MKIVALNNIRFISTAECYVNAIAKCVMRERIVLN